MITLTINGVNLDTALGSGSLSINSIKGRGPAKRDAELLEVPGRNGAFLRRVKTPPRVLEIAITVRSSSASDLRSKVDALNEIVTTDAVVPMRFSDENKTYYGVLSDTSNWDEIRNFGKGTLLFTCPDPHKYTDEEFVAFDPSDTAPINASGNEETEPRFEATALSDITHVDFVRQDGEYMRLGVPADINAEVFERETLVLHDKCDTTSGWTTATYVEDGYISGSIAAQGGSFVANTWGTNIQPSAFQGPSIKRSIGEALNQFQVDVLIENLNTGGMKIGMIEIYLLDADNNTVAKIGNQDSNRTSEVINNKFQLGAPSTNRVQKYFSANENYGWNDFDGIMRLKRELVDGVYRYTPYFGVVYPNGKHYWRTPPWSYYDFSKVHTAPITQIQVAIRKWPVVDPTLMRVKDIKVYRINDVPNAVPIILKAGDSLVVDHRTEDILINGESRKDLKDFGATFFKLKPGSNTLYQFPQGALNTKVYWRDKFR